MSPLRIGILGAAKIARRSTVPAMLSTDGVEVVGVAARDAARAADFAGEFGISAYESYDAVLADDSVDAVYIPLPTSLHHRWTMAALANGKHVLCEKSLAGTLSEVAEMVGAADEHDLVLFENFMCERHPQNLEARSLIAAGALGTVHQVSLSFGFPPFPREDQRNSAELAGGALNDAGAYCLDMAAFYLNAEPVAVTAVLDDADYDVDVIGSALVEFAGGTTAALSFGFQHDYRNEVRVWGETGQLDIDRSFSIPADRVPSVTLTRNTQRETLPIAAADQFALQIEAFRDAVRQGTGGPERHRRLAHARAMEAVRISARERRRVELAELVTA